MANNLGDIDVTELRINGVLVTAGGGGGGGGGIGAVESVTGHTTLGVDTGLCLVTTSGAAINITLPSASSAQCGPTIKKTIGSSAHAVNIIGTVDGIANGLSIVTPGGYISLFPDAATGWYEVGRN